MKTEIRTFTTSSTAATRTWEIWCYARNKSSIAAGAILSVDWYELWEHVDDTNNTETAEEFSLIEAYGLNGPGVNIFKHGPYYDSLSGIGHNGAGVSIDTTTFGYPVYKCVSTAANTQIYILNNTNGLTSTIVTGKTYLISADIYSPDSTTCNVDIENCTDISYSRTIRNNTWCHVWYLGTKTNSNGTITFYGPAGTYYYKNIKICEAPKFAMHYSAYSLCGDDSFPYTENFSFLDLQNKCKNTEYFSTNEPKNALRSWMGYYYKIGTFLHSSSLSTASVGAGGGTITISYNIKDVWSNDKKTNLSGVKPTITTTLGSIGSISSTDNNGNGSAVLTVSSRGTTPGSELTGTVTISYGNVTKTLSFTQALNQVESIRVKATFNLSKYTATAGENTITAAGTGGAYLKFTSGVETEIVDSTSNTSKYGGTIAFTRTYTTSGTGFSNNSKKITVANRGTTIGAARTGTVTSKLTAVFTRTTPTSGTVTESETYTQTIEQEANNVTEIKAVVSDTNASSCHWYYEKGSKVANALSKDGESITPIVNGACIFTFTSGEKSDKIGAVGDYQGKTVSFNRTYSGSATGFALNASTGVVTATKNTTIDTRSIVVTSALTAKWGDFTHTLTQSRTVYQAAGNRMNIYVKGLNNTVDQYLDFSTGYVEIKYYNDSTAYTNNIGFSGQFSTNSTYTYIVNPDYPFAIFRDTGKVPQNITISFNNANFYNNVNYNSYNGCDMSIEFYSPSKGTIYTTSSQNISTNSNPLHGRNISKTFTIPSNMNYAYKFPDDTVMNIRFNFYN
jgi:hypothetical protein